jgi:hypothetical protein
MLNQPVTVVPPAGAAVDALAVLVALLVEATVVGDATLEAEELAELVALDVVVATAALLVLVVAEMAAVPPHAARTLTPARPARAAPSFSTARRLEGRADMRWDTTDLPFLPMLRRCGMVLNEPGTAVCLFAVSFLGR